MTPRFLLDPHLAELARWLRWLGYDAELRPGSGAEARRRLATTRRIYVTTSDRWAAWASRRGATVVHLPRAPTDRQLVELIGRLDLRREPRFDRCGICNLRLESAPEVPPPESARRHGSEATLRCPGCGRLYWEGGHTARIRATLARWLAEEPGVGGAD